MRFMRHTIGRMGRTSVLLLALGTQVAAQGVPQVERVARAVHVSHKPSLDGTLGDPLWQLADTISDFRQREPDSGKPSTEKTVVRILYTRDEVFFGLSGIAIQTGKLLHQRLGKACVRSRCSVSGRTKQEILIDIQRPVGLAYSRISEKDSPGGDGFPDPSVILIAASLEA